MRRLGQFFGPLLKDVLAELRPIILEVIKSYLGGLVIPHGPISVSSQSPGEAGSLPVSSTISPTPEIVPVIGQALLVATPEERERILGMVTALVERDRANENPAFLPFSTGGVGTGPAGSD
jgi:hypothetical protein